MKKKTLDPERLKELRRMRAVVSRMLKSEVAAQNPEFKKRAKEFVSLVPYKNEAYLRMAIRANTSIWLETFFDERVNEFEHLVEWHNRMQRIPELKQEDPTDIRKEKVTKIKSGRGGARPGAGRKRIGTTRTIKLTLPDEDWAFLQLIAPTPSEAIRDLVRNWREIEKSAPGHSGLSEAVRWMEERIGTSLDRVGAGDPEAIATMERNMLKETLKARTKRAGRK
jgi:hypothetical protein